MIRFLSHVSFLACPFAVLVTLAIVPSAGAQSTRTNSVTESTNPRSVATPWQARSRSEHQTEWFSVRYTTNAATGRVRATTNAYVELGSYLNRSNSLGQWQPSSPAFQITATGAEANAASHRVTLNADIASGAVRIEKGGVILQGQPLCVAYYDPVDGRSLMLAELMNATGWLVASNEVVYSNCFDGLRASIRYRNSLDGLEQDLILHERPAVTPAELGFSDKTRLELFTEWVGNTPLPEKSTRLLEREKDADLRRQMVEPDLTDSTLIFATFRMGRGKAFTTGDSSLERTNARLDSVSVAKRFEVIDGRKILIEALPLKRVEAMLNRLSAAPLSGALTNATLRLRLTTNGTQLAQARSSVLPLPGAADEVSAKDKSIPAGAEADQQTKTQDAKLETRNPKLDPDVPVRILPAKRLAQIKKDARIQTAAYSNSKPETRNTELAFVLDWQTEITGGPTDFTFSSATTYVCNASVNLYGTTRIQGGTVVRFAPLPATAVLKTYGPVICETEPYRPAFFVSKFDPTIGEVVDYANTAPATYAGALQLNVSSQLRHLRVRHANEAIRGWDLNVRHSQFSYCGTVLYHETGYGTAPTRVDNVLFYDVGYGFGGTYYYAIVSHLTVEKCWGALASDPYDRSMASYVNCLGVNVDSMGNVPYATTSSDLGAIGTVFQTKGAASHYLAPSSPHRGVGSTNIDPTLLAELKQTTTYPPQVLTGALTANQTLAPSLLVVRNASPNLDRGYAYDVVDYLARGLRVENSSLPVTLLATNGVTVAVEPNSSTYGIWFGQNAQFISVGSPVASNRFVMAHSIFENKPSVAWNAYDGFSTFQGASLGSTPKASLRFTDLPMISGNYYHIPGDSSAAFVNLAMQDTTLRGGILYLIPNNPSQLMAFTNCLFENVDFKYRPYAPATLRVWNNLFKKGTLTIEDHPPDYSSVGVWRDNLFDGTIISQLGGATTDHDYNAYVHTTQNTTRLNSTPGPHDQPLSASPAYETGPFGKYYLQGAPTALIDKGSRTAADAGLYHYTTRKTAGSKDGTEPPSPYQVDLGLHYVAANASNQPLDTDGDTLADFQEDANGNGLGDATETSLAESDTDGDGLDDAFELRVSHTGALNPDTGATGVSDGYKDSDNDGWTNIDEARNGTDPNVWNAPPGPRLTLLDYIMGSHATLEWEPASGAVSEYVIERSYHGPWVEIGRVSSLTTGFVDSNLPDTLNPFTPFNEHLLQDVMYRVKAVYGAGSSQWSELVRPYDPAVAVESHIVNGPGGHPYLVTSHVPEDIHTVRMHRLVSSISPEYPYDCMYGLGTAINCYDVSQVFHPVTGNGSFDLPAESVQNGVALISDSEAAPYGNYHFAVEPLGSTAFPPVVSSSFYFVENVPFLDGSAQLKQNLHFLLRAADSVESFSYYNAWVPFGGPLNHVAATFWPQSPTYPNPFEPFEQNRYWRNFLFSQTEFNPEGVFTTGVASQSPYTDSHRTVSNPKYGFDTFGFASVVSHK